METKKFQTHNFITVPGFAIVQLGLSGNDLLCYALIYGFTQDRETEFRGSLNYISSALNVTRQNAKRILDRLIDRGLIVKKEVFISGIKLCHYVAETATVLPKQQQGVIKTATPPVAETATIDNDIIDNNKDIDKASGCLFSSDPNYPVVVTKPRRTSEPNCLFADSKFNDYDKFAAEFTAEEFKDVDICYYYNAVSDWSNRFGKKQKDWIATARNFMRNDNRDGKLVKLNKGGLDPDAIEYLREMAD